MLFYKILQGIIECHKKNICHLDIKLNNILLDDKYNPKITDFGCSTKIDDCNVKLENYICGTSHYICPEILHEKPYDGFKADIFSLGVILFQLITYKNAFETPNDYFDLFKGNMKKNLGKKIDLKIYEDFIYLVLDMINYDPEKRPNIEKISDYKWLKDIKDQEKLKKLEVELKKEFQEREKIIDYSLKKTIKSNKFTKVENYGNSHNKGGNEIINYKNFFEDYKIEQKEDFKFDNNYVKIKGYLDPGAFMSELIYNLYKHFFIKENNIGKNGEFKFMLTKEYNKDDDDNPELEDKLYELGIEDCEAFKMLFEKKDFEIEVKIFRLDKDTHLVRFINQSGDIKDYYDNIKIVISEIEEILK